MKQLTLRTMLTGMVVFLTVIALALPVWAQDSDADEAEDPEAAEEFSEEVTVTARKREETLQDVPFSVVAPTEEILRERGAQNLEDISANVGGFTVQNLGPG